jgi:hypothetical protein
MTASFSSAQIRGPLDEGWFGAAWTTLEDNKQPKIAFKSEYLQILERRKAKPYRYGTRESCLSAVRDLLSEQVQP